MENGFYSCSKRHSGKRIVGLVLAVALLLPGANPASAGAEAAQTADKAYEMTVLPETYQTVKGWGLFPASVDASFADKTAAHEALYDELGITQFRVELRGQYGNADGTVNSGISNLIAVIQTAADHGITDYSMHIWSPPAGMKDNNSISGLLPDGSPASLLPEKEGDFCNWVVRSIQSIEDQGYPAPVALSIQNEPEAYRTISPAGMKRTSTFE